MYPDTVGTTLIDIYKHEKLHRKVVEKIEIIYAMQLLCFWIVNELFRHSTCLLVGNTRLSRHMINTMGYYVLLMMQAGTRDFSYIQKLKKILVVATSHHYACSSQIGVLHVPGYRGRAVYNAQTDEPSREPDFGRALTPPSILTQ